MNRSALNSWVTFPRPNPQARLRLFCFPYAGGGASVFFGWPALLPPDVEVCAVQPPGREGRLVEKPYSDMLELVERMGPELLPYMDKPFAFAGHSNGAVMAFELTRKLRREGRTLPLHLFVTGRPAPQLPNRHPPIHDLPEPRFIEELRRLQGTPEEVLQNREIMELITPLLRADFSLAETYKYSPEPALDVPLSAYGGIGDADVRPDEVEPWGEQTGAAFTFRTFPGDHFFINTQRQMVLEQMSAELRGVTARLARGAAAHGF
ncbi:MAG TPA: thioesterase domain-containing protein [Longimicrobiaceae bacterium]|jgi:medium-chain acyl-[acyl-carrier-protein] hydrolase|nr:thioesterase domain-containing protein [Longimicrobiaceae bacterium]